ncbi:DUF882 domain-containing protein [Cohaesibacter haloalkalitolerans]|uniref:DUF882 domain-containing protein n=1 Tax=Cohaesibacter haloalkalitolerans TaxID=1162980 RepID=UPI000E658C04
MILSSSRPERAASQSPQRRFREGLSRLLALLFVSLLLLTAQAQASSRSLRLSNAHTKETATITYKRNGKFDADGLRKLNQFLRDWRRNEKTQMDPALFDLIWEVYQKTGAKEPITVFSGYRSPATNGMLRDRSSGVAKNSRHTMGQAMDFYLPGVPLAKIREVGLRMQAGGVGYYPGSRFIHIDTGNVRHWPRMTRQQLAKVFPDGVTVHVPTDGKPLSGYQIAKAQVAQRKAEMARSTRSVGRFTQYASAAPAEPARKLTNTQVATLARSQEQKDGSLLQTLLRQTPKEPPQPRFAATQPDSNSDPEAEADEVIEEGPSAQTLLLPQTLAALPKAPANRTVQSTTITLAEQTADTPSNIPFKQETQDTLAAVAPETVASAEPAAGPVQAPTVVAFASLPRSRPESLGGGARFQLASAETKPLPASATAETGAEARQLAMATGTNGQPDVQPVPETMPFARATDDGMGIDTPPAVGEPVQMASLPRARLATGATAAAPAQATPAQKQPASTGDMLAQMVGKQDGATPNRFAYASAGNTFLAALPSDGPRPRVGNGAASAPERQVASLPRNNPSLAQPAPRAQKPARAATAEQEDYDQLARLTFAYGPSGMAHFAHMKQRASTATFARLSRPAPNNLKGLVYKPHSMINQGFAPLLIQRLDTAHFEGPAIARLAVRNFN